MKNLQNSKKKILIFFVNNSGNFLENLPLHNLSSKFSWKIFTKFERNNMVKIYNFIYKLFIHYYLCYSRKQICTKKILFRPKNFKRVLTKVYLHPMFFFCMFGFKINLKNPEKKTKTEKRGKNSCLIWKFMQKRQKCYKFCFVISYLLCLFLKIS